MLINCAGLYSDKIAILDGIRSNLQIVPFRGDYFRLTKAGAHKVRNLIYPVPDPAFPFLGAHFTRIINGETECGPNAVLSLKREGYSWKAFSLSEALDALTFPGTLRLIGANPIYGLEELYSAVSRRHFLKRLNRLIPGLTLNDIEPARSGVRAMALKRSGEIVDDFVIHQQGNNLHVLNAPSPAATACLSIGEEIGMRSLSVLNG